MSLTFLNQTRILEWVAFPFSRESSQPRDWTTVSCIAGGFFVSWATRVPRCVLQIWSLSMCSMTSNSLEEICFHVQNCIIFPHSQFYSLENKPLYFILSFKSWHAWAQNETWFPWRNSFPTDLRKFMFLKIVNLLLTLSSWTPNKGPAAQCHSCRQKETEFSWEAKEGDKSLILSPKNGEVGAPAPDRCPPWALF